MLYSLKQSICPRAFYQDQFLSKKIVKRYEKSFEKKFPLSIFDPKKLVTCPSKKVYGNEMGGNYSPPET